MPQSHGGVDVRKAHETRNVPLASSINQRAPSSSRRGRRRRRGRATTRGRTKPAVKNAQRPKLVCTVCHSFYWNQSAFDQHLQGRTHREFAELAQEAAVSGVGDSGSDGWDAGSAGTDASTNDEFNGADIARAFLLRKAERLQELRNRRQVAHKLRRERRQQNRLNQRRQSQFQKSGSSGSTSWSWSSSSSYWQPHFDSSQHKSSQRTRFDGQWDGNYFNPHTYSEAEQSSMDQPEHDWYDVLGVQPNATRGEIRKAFHKKARKNHPDKVAGTAAEEQMKLLNQAYGVLNDTEQRKAYDDTRQQPSFNYESSEQTRFDGHCDGNYFNPHPGPDAGHWGGDHFNSHTYSEAGQPPMEQPEHDWYDVLGVQPSATRGEIRKAFHQEARKNHPDKVTGTASEERMKLLNQAYGVLNDPEQRKAYDDSRQQPSFDYEASATYPPDEAWDAMPSGSTVLYEEEVFHSPFHTATFPGVDMFQSMREAVESNMGFQNAHVFENVW